MDPFTDPLTSDLIKPDHLEFWGLSKQSHYRRGKNYFFLYHFYTIDSLDQHIREFNYVKSAKPRLKFYRSLDWPAKPRLKFYRNVDWSAKCRLKHAESTCKIFQSTCWSVDVLVKLQSRFCWCVFFDECITFAPKFVRWRSRNRKKALD